LGNHLPGPGAVFAGMTMRFERPVRIGDTVIARATVTEVDVKGRKVKLACVCEVEGQTCMEADAEVIVRKRRKRAACRPTRAASFTVIRICRSQPAAPSWRWAISTACIGAMPPCWASRRNWLARRLAPRLARRSSAPHPRRVFAPDAPPFSLMNDAQRVRALQAEHGAAEIIHHIPFNAALAAMSPERFVEEVLHQGLGAKGRGDRRGFLLRQGPGGQRLRS
jgi:acyl-CoA hydrolase